MGLFYTAYNVKFSELILDFEVLKSDHGPFYDQLGEEVFSIKSTRIDGIVTPLEKAWEFLDASVKKNILPFFLDSLLFYYDEELVEDYLNMKIPPLMKPDDLGWLEKQKHLYERSYSCNRLKRLLQDFDSFVDTEEIRRAYFISRAWNEHEFVPEYYTHEEYLDNTYQNFNGFVTMLNQIVAAYRTCVAENKDLIIDFG